MMFRVLLAALILAFYGLPCRASSPVAVRTVHDGDTVVLSCGEQVRYLGIDAPELGRKGARSDFMAIASRNRNLQLVRNARVRLEFDEERRDRYGRLLAYVFLENGEMINLLLVREGLAFVLAKKPNLKHFPLLLDAQRKALAEKVGIWSRPPEKPEPRYLGNRNSFRFHRPGCPMGRKIARQNLVHFDAWEKAYWEGFSPCGRCKP
jgi:micrococcal nuclease